VGFFAAGGFDTFFATLAVAEVEADFFDALVVTAAPPGLAAGEAGGVERSEEEAFVIEAADPAAGDVGGRGESEAKRLPWLEVPSGVPGPGGVADDERKVNGPVPTFSISNSRPRFCPRPVTGTDELRSSLPRVELRSEPTCFFLLAVVALGAER